MLLHHAYFVTQIILTFDAVEKHYQVNQGDITILH
jgi:hypothetical protein